MWARIQRSRPLTTLCARITISARRRAADVEKSPRLDRHRLRPSSSPCTARRRGRRSRDAPGCCSRSPRRQGQRPLTGGGACRGGDTGAGEFHCFAFCRASKLLWLRAQRRPPQLAPRRREGSPVRAVCHEAALKPSAGRSRRRSPKRRHSRQTIAKSLPHCRQTVGQYAAYTRRVVARRSPERRQYCQTVARRPASYC